MTKISKDRKAALNAFDLFWYSAGNPDDLARQLKPHVETIRNSLLVCEELLEALKVARGNLRLDAISCTDLKTIDYTIAKATGARNDR